MGSPEVGVFVSRVLVTARKIHEEAISEEPEDLDSRSEGRGDDGARAHGHGRSMKSDRKSCGSRCHRERGVEVTILMRNASKRLPLHQKSTSGIPGRGRALSM